MIKHVGIFTALLTATWALPAIAEDDDSAKKIKRAEKVIAAMDSLGIQNATINQLVRDVSNNTEDGYIHLARQDLESINGTVSLRYDTGSPNLKRLELNYTSKSERYRVTANSQGVMFRYRYEIK